MNRFLFTIAFVSLLSLGLVATSQANPMVHRGFTAYDTTNLIGHTVKACDGVQLGQIFDLVVDSNGHVDFAIVSEPGSDEFPGRLVAVPFSTLMISKGTSGQLSVVFNGDKEKFYEGPEIYTNLNNLKQAASVDRYYGVHPYWIRAAGKAGYDGYHEHFPG